MENFRSKINDIYKKIQSTNGNNFIGKTASFVLHYWFILIFIVVLIIIVQIKSSFNNNFHTNKITKFVPDSNYAGNAVVLNKQNFLTTYDIAFNACKPKSKDQDIILFVVTSDGKYYGVDVIRYDKELNLAVLRLSSSYEDSAYIKNYVIFPKKYDSLLDSSVYVSKTKNTNESYFYKKSEIKGISDNGYYIKRNNFRSNNGESVLNNNLEFVGLSDGNTKSSRFKYLFNEVNIISQNKIENFLIKNRIVYRRNVKNINLFKVNNYLREINVKVVCYLKTNRKQIIIRGNQLF